MDSDLRNYSRDLMKIGDEMVIFHGDLMGFNDELQYGKSLVSLVHIKMPEILMVVYIF